MRRRVRPNPLRLFVLLAVAVLVLALAGERGQSGVQALPITRPAADSGDRTVTNADLVLHGGEVVSHDAFVIHGKLEVQPGAEVTHDAAVTNGSANIYGKVDHDLTVTNGSITIGGTVGHNVTATNGDITLLDGSRVGGEVRLVNGTLHRAASAQVSGSVATSAGSSSDDGGFLGDVARLVASLVLSLVFIAAGTVIVLAWPLQTGRAAGLLESTPWSAVGVGLVTGLFALPVLGLVNVILAITVIGIFIAIPLDLVIFLAWFYGLTSLGLWAGRRVADSGHLPSARGSLLLTALTGLGLIAVSLLLLSAVVPPLGWALVYFAGFIGLGAAILDRLGVQGQFSWSSLTHGPHATHPLSGPPVVPPSDRKAS